MVVVAVLVVVVVEEVCDVWYFTLSQTSLSTEVGSGLESRYFPYSAAAAHIRVCSSSLGQTHTHTHTHTYKYKHIGVRVCVCFCVERSRHLTRQSEYAVK